MLIYHTFKDLNIQGIYDHDPLLKYYHLPLASEIKNKKVLDVGCASGYFSKYFSERGGIVTAIDICPESISYLKEKYSWNIDIVSQDVLTMQYQNEYDIIFCGSLLMHIFDPILLLKNIYNALKPGGIFILCTGGINSNDPVIRVERYLGREKSPHEKEISSANESIWWLSQNAGNYLLHNVGFKNYSFYPDGFNLKTTSYGISIGHDFSALHYVWKASKN